MIAPSDASCARNLAICAAGSPLAAPLVILKSFTSTYIPSLLLSVPNSFPELQLSPIPLISGESCQGLNAKLDAMAPIPIPATTPSPRNIDFDRATLASQVWRSGGPSSNRLFLGQ